MFCFLLLFICLVTEPIKIEVEPMHQRQKEGSRVEFKCNVQGNKKVFYQWVKDGTEMQGQNSSSLVLDCVEMRDFGCYACHVSDPNADCIKSSAAVLDVAPRDGMGQCCLNCNMFLPFQGQGLHRSGNVKRKKFVIVREKSEIFLLNQGKLK